MNRFFFAFCVYTALIWGIDLLRTFCGVTMLQAFCLGGLFIGGALFLCCREISFSRDDFTKWDGLVFLLLTLAYLIQSPLPVRDWDVISYHILHQQQLPWNQVTESFFPSTILHSHLLPLADRLSYPFYNLLGFRMGTIFNLFVVGVIYVQVRQILKEGWAEVRDGWLAVFAFSITVSLGSIHQLYSYYTDIRAVPIILFFLYEFLNHTNAKSKKMLLFMAWCVGVEICFKLSAGVPVLLCIVYFLYVSRKNISVLLLCEGTFLALLPLIPYGYINFIEAQSPLFPFFNHFFNSSLLLHSEDAKYILGDIVLRGPQNYVQAFLWPLYALFHEDDVCMMRREVFLLLFSGISAWLLWTQHNENKRTFYHRLVIAHTAFYLLGVFVYHSFMRYNPGLDITASILCGLAAFVLFVRQGRHKYIAVIFAVVLLVQPVFFGGKHLRDLYRDWSDRNDNIMMLFHDYDQVYPFASKVRSWLSMGAQPTSGYAYLLKKNVPIIALDGYAPMYADMDGTYENPVARELYEKHMQRWLGNGMYILLQTEPGRPTFLKDGIHQKTLMGELVQILLQRGVRLQNYEQIRPNFIRIDKNITMAEAVPASGSMAFNDYLLTQNSSCKLDKAFQGDSRYTLTMALKPDKFGSVPQESFSGHVDLYDRASHRLLSRQNFASDGEYVTIELSTAGEVEVVFDHTTAASVQELMILAYEEADHDNGGANRAHTE